MDSSIVLSQTKAISKVLSKNSPTILTGLAVTGLIATVALAIKATPKAIEIIEMEKDYREQEVQDKDHNKPIDVIDTVKLTWKPYLPTILMCAATISCIVAANNINLRRNAALASLFSVTEATLKEYQAKVVEQIGEKKEEKLRSEIAQERLNNNPVDEKTVILTGRGQYLCYDAFSARYFRSDVECLRKAENTFNQRLLREGWLGINEFYYEIGLEPIELGDEMGWIAERSLLDLKFDSKLSKDIEPCLFIGYSVSPIHI